jgi:hypothetical protein
MKYITKTGKVRKTYLLSKSRQKEMIENGWFIGLANSCHEGTQELYNRLSERYSDVRIYEDSTMVRGYHTTFAMCKF